MNKSSCIVFIRRDPVLSVSWVLALVSMVFVIPSPSYFQYIDWKVLGCLFALMLVVAGLRKMYVFTKIQLCFCILHIPQDKLLPYWSGLPFSLQWA